MEADLVSSRKLMRFMLLMPTQIQPSLKIRAPCKHRTSLSSCIHIKLSVWIIKIGHLINTFVLIQPLYRQKSIKTLLRLEFLPVILHKEFSQIEHYEVIIKARLIRFVIDPVREQKRNELVNWIGHVMDHFKDHVVCAQWRNLCVVLVLFDFYTVVMHLSHQMIKLLENIKNAIFLK